MKNIYLTLALTALIPIAGYTDGGSFEKTSSSKKNGATKTTPYHEYHNRVIIFDPAHQGYERIKPDDLYWGIEGWLVYTENNHRHFLVNGEARMGYNFFYNGTCHLTPFAGVGYIQDFAKRHHHLHTHKPGIVYGTVGFLYDHEFGDVINVGVNLKGLLGGPTNRKHFNWGSPVVGADLAVPITFRFGRNRHWDFRIEPFNTYLYGSHASAYYVGFRNTIGYRF